MSIVTSAVCPAARGGSCSGGSGRRTDRAPRLVTPHCRAVNVRCVDRQLVVQRRAPRPGVGFRYRPAGDAVPPVVHFQFGIVVPAELPDHGAP